MRLTLAVVLICAAVSVDAAAQTSNRGRDHERRHERSSDPASAFWGGVLGGWIAQAFRPGREGEDVEGDAELEPWSKAWFNYCTSRYRSFDPRTGRYLGFDGEHHFCGG